MNKKLALFGRRGFVGGVLVALGAVGGTLVRAFQSPSAVRKTRPTKKTSNFVYDISEWETTDRSMLLYEPEKEFETGFKRCKRIAAHGDKVFVAGDRSIKIFSSSGSLESEIKLSRPPHCMHITPEKELYVGLANFYEVYNFAGEKKLRAPRPEGENTFLTAIAVHEDTVYVADAGMREVLVCDRKTGVVKSRFGKKDEELKNPGIVVPSPYFDLMVSGVGEICLANTGRLRMETYSLDGRFKETWGGPGMDVDKFCGCCNPVYFTLAPNGDYITSEKGLARINVYGPDGKFKGAVAGPDMLVEDKALAKQACNDCSVGAGFDVAIDDNGRVLALDPFRMTVRVFKPIDEKNTAA